LFQKKHLHNDPEGLFASRNLCCYHIAGALRHGLSRILETMTRMETDMARPWMTSDDQTGQAVVHRAWSSRANCPESFEPDTMMKSSVPPNGPVTLPPLVADRRRDFRSTPSSVAGPAPQSVMNSRRLMLVLQVLQETIVAGQARILEGPRRGPK
jgi:hypothetical protein